MVVLHGGLDNICQFFSMFQVFFKNAYVEKEVESVILHHSTITVDYFGVVLTLSSLINIFRSIPTVITQSSFSYESHR